MKLNLLKTLAPTIAKTIASSNPVAGMAVKMLSDKLGIDEKNPAKIEKFFALCSFGTFRCVFGDFSQILAPFLERFWLTFWSIWAPFLGRFFVHLGAARETEKRQRET